MPETASLPHRNSSDSDRAGNPILGRFIRFLQRIKGLIIAQKLPAIAQKTCEVYLEGSNTALQNRCQQLLQARLSLNPAQVHRFFQTAMGESLLGWFESFFHWPSHHDPRQSLRDILVQMAADPEGLSLISALHHCPDTLEINLDHLLLTAKRVEGLIEATRTTTEAIRNLSLSEMQQIPEQQLAALSNLRVMGNFSVQRSRLAFPGRARQGDSNSKTSPLEVACYAPSPWPLVPTPVIVQSHGLASNPEDIEGYAQHLASYGYFVVAPQHPGSDVQQVRRMLAGETSEVFRFSEFVNRPWDISHLLDQLGQADHPWTGKLNLEQVGIMGCSFGAYTAFALAGARFHFEGLEQVCSSPLPDPNLSLLLQCQALTLPRQAYQLQDPRVRAVFSLDSVGSSVFGTAGLSQIQVPVMLIAGSHDIAAPLVLEQVHIFRDLEGANQYLVLAHGKPHVQDMRRFLQALTLDIDGLPFLTSTSETGSAVETSIRAISIAFFDHFLRPSRGDARYLTPDYATFLSQSSDALWLISEKSKATLNQTIQTYNGQQRAEFSSLAAPVKPLA